MSSNTIQDLSGPQVALVVGLLNILAGFVGADAASETIIERILWPQRATSGFGTTSNILQHAFLLSAGGPLHRVATHVIEQMIEHSLHKGAGRGHMLGTAFYPDTRLNYKMHAGNGQPVSDELVRNGLLVRILKTLPYLQPIRSGQQATAQRMRQQITVSHLELVNPDGAPATGVITLDDDRITARTILAIVVSETPALLLVAAVTLLQNARIAFVFVAPLVLKLLAAATALQREDFVTHGRDGKKGVDGHAPSQSFEVHIPGEGFQVMSGPAELVLPFFRHYGHPIRCRWREAFQLLLIGLLGILHPLTLAMVLFMPIQIQAMFATYQAYLWIAMLAARFGGGDVWGTTEERVGKALLDAERSHRPGFLMLKNRMGEMAGVKLTRTWHASYAEGQMQVAKIVAC